MQALRTKFFEVGQNLGTRTSVDSTVSSRPPHPVAQPVAQTTTHQSLLKKRYKKASSNSTTDTLFKSDTLLTEPLGSPLSFSNNGEDNDGFENILNSPVDPLPINENKFSLWTTARTDGHKDSLCTTAQTDDNKEKPPKPVWPSMVDVEGQKMTKRRLTYEMDKTSAAMHSKRFNFSKVEPGDKSKVKHMSLSSFPTKVDVSQFYFSKARYSPIRTYQKNNSLAFGSKAPRFPPGIYSYYTDMVHVCSLL